MRDGRGQAGFTLVEVIVAVGTLLIVMVGFTQINSLRYSLLARVRAANAMSEAVMANVIEVKTRDVGTFKDGQCLIRRYDPLGNYQSETRTTLSDPACGGTELPEQIFEVYWKIKGPASIDAVFTPAKFLKLPKLKESVWQVEVFGRTRAPPPGPPEHVLGAVIFR